MAMASTGKRAPSLWLQYHYKEPGDILMQDVFVPKSGLASCTYYCCLNWNSGREGGGYCGIQDHPDGRAFIFSIWDPQKSQGVPITASYKGPGTWTDRFGGEGTGLKSMNFELGWKEDQWYTMVVRRWDGPNESTRFGCWVHDQVADQWTHLITMDYPVPGVFFAGTTVSFLEDWAFTSQKYRCGWYKNGFKRGTDGKWIPFSKVTFQVNVEDTATMNFNASCENPQDGVCIAAGADTEASFGTRCDFVQQCCGDCPDKTPISLVQAAFDKQSIRWKLADKCVPQFSYRVRAGDNEIGGGVDEGARVIAVDGLPVEGEKVTVEVEDLLGNTDTKVVS